MFLWKDIKPSHVSINSVSKKYAIKCVNRGMWGCTSLLKSNGKTITYDTKEEAQKEVDRINESRSLINNFTEYFVTEIEMDK